MFRLSPCLSCCEPGAAMSTTVHVSFWIMVCPDAFPRVGESFLLAKGWMVGGKGNRLFQMHFEEGHAGTDRNWRQGTEKRQAWLLGLGLDPLSRWWCQLQTRGRLREEGRIVGKNQEFPLTNAKSGNSGACLGMPSSLSRPAPYEDRAQPPPWRLPGVPEEPAEEAACEAEAE